MMALRGFVLYNYCIGGWDEHSLELDMRRTVYTECYQILYFLHRLDASFVVKFDSGNKAQEPQVCM
jgi:hypothetical protein